MRYFPTQTVCNKECLFTVRHHCDVMMCYKASTVPKLLQPQYNDKLNTHLSLLALSLNYVKILFHLDSPIGHTPTEKKLLLELLFVFPLLLRNKAANPQSHSNRDQIKFNFFFPGGSI